jgi:hypothetical protein
MEAIDFGARLVDASGVAELVLAASPVAPDTLLFAGLALLFSACAGTSATVMNTKPAHNTFIFRMNSHPFHFRIRDSIPFGHGKGGWHGT